MCRILSSAQLLKLNKSSINLFCYMRRLGSKKNRLAKEDDHGSHG